VSSLNQKEPKNILELYENYGSYICKVGEAMDKAGISISKMRRLTGLNHEIVKRIYFLYTEV